MPVFFAKHDFLKVSEGDNAQIQLPDLRIRQEFGCCILAYWCDLKRKTTFSLIDAPDIESVREMHWCLHHSYPIQIIQIEEDIIESFLNCIESLTASGQKNPPQALFYPKPMVNALMVLKLYSGDLFSTKNPTIRKSHLEDFLNRSQTLVRKHKGRIINTDSDGGVYSFDSLSLCIKAALQIRQELFARININGNKTIILNIGIDGRRNMNGRCDPFEETSKHARRLCYIAGNNQIVISSQMNEQLKLEHSGVLLKNAHLKSFNSKEEQFLTQVMKIIELNYKEDFKIGDFCKIMGESRSQLYRKILEVTNLSPIELINEFRLKRATELMNSQEGNNISQIAYEAGFNSLSYFSRRFKKRFGHLPSAYMNRT